MRRETDVLSAPADGERQLFIGHHDFHAMGFFVEHYLRHFCRCQCIDDERRGFRIPRDNVDALTLQFLHDSLHTHTTHADTGAYRVD